MPFLEDHPEVQEVLSASEEEARRLGHNYVGTEHLVLGLCTFVTAHPDSIAAKVFAVLGLEAAKIAEAINSDIGEGDYPFFGEIVPLTSQAKRVIELAVAERIELSSYPPRAKVLLGAEHLLLGLIRDEEGIAGGVLLRFGVTLEKVRAETRKVLFPNFLQPEEKEEDEFGFEQRLTLIIKRLKEGIRLLNSLSLELRRLGEQYQKEKV